MTELLLVASIALAVANVASLALLLRLTGRWERVDASVETAGNLARELRGILESLARRKE